MDLDKEYEGEGVDLISGLPNDLLVYMLSLVDLKTAGRSSLLSKRWRHVWTYLMNLDFNDPETTATAESLSFTCYAQHEMDIFVERVNQVIGANQAPYLDTFIIRFPLNISYDANIDNWLKFVFRKEVRNLELAHYSRINFFNIFSINPALIINTTLESLQLESVSINGPLLHWIVTNCVNLQRLSFDKCKANADSKHRKLVVSSYKLKHLEFFFSLKSLNIDALELSAPNLTTFILYESEIDVMYRSVPSLVDATFGGPYFRHIFHDLDTISAFSSQLQKLSFHWFYQVHSGFLTFVNVEQLEIAFSQLEDDFLYLTTSLIEACPLLHTFNLKLMYRNQLGGPMQSLALNNAQLLSILSHKHLKTVEYVGYAGSASAAMLARCLTRHAPVLERFIFDTSVPCFIGKSNKVSTYDYRYQKEIVRSSELLAKQIQGLVDVVIL